MINAVNSARNAETTHLSPEVQRQQAAKTAPAKPQSVPQDSVSLKSTGDQDHDGDSK